MCNFSRHVIMRFYKWIRYLSGGQGKPYPYETQISVETTQALSETAQIPYLNLKLHDCAPTRTRLRWLWLIGAIILLAACGGGGDMGTSQEIPTLVVMPTDLPTATLGTPNPAGAAMLATPISDTPTPTPNADVGDSVATTDEAALPTLALSQTITLTPSKTITSTITPTITLIPTDTRQPSALEELVLTALVSTVLPPNFASTPGGIGSTPNAPFFTPTVYVPTLSACSFPPTGGFATFFATDPTLRERLGCPLGNFNTVRPAASQVFQQGVMIWASGTPSYIYVIYSNATYQRLMDTFNEASDPISGGEIPPAPNLLEPVRGFGKVWRDNPSVRAGLGWATANEQGGTATSLDFERGLMLHISTRGEIYALVGLDTGTWQVLFGTP